MTVISRYMCYFLCFLISGLINVSLDLATGISLDDTGAMALFLVQPIAFAVEDVASYLWYPYRGHSCKEATGLFLGVGLFFLDLAPVRPIRCF